MRDGVGAVQSVLVLGGRSDIAVATAGALVRDGARTVILGVRSTEDAHIADELRASGALTVETARFDADDVDSHPGVVADVFDRHGDIDVVLLAFGVLGDQVACEHDASAAMAVLQTNFVGAVSIMIPVVERLHAQGHGALVVLSSVAGERARRSNFVYGSSKAGLDAFAQGLGDSLAGSGVHVMVVRPGFVRTKMTRALKPAPLSTTPEAVAAVIVDGLRRSAHTVWAPPALRIIMAVLRHLPRPIFRRLPI